MMDGKEVKKAEVGTKEADNANGVVVEETKTTVTPTSKSREYMQGKYPDKVWADDEAYDADLLAHLQQADSDLEGYKAGDDALASLMERDPDFARVMDAVRKGMPMGVALRTYMGDLSDYEPAEDEPNYEAYKKASDDYLAEKKKASDAIAEREKNLVDSDAVLEAFAAERGLTDEQEDEFMDKVSALFTEIGRGKITRETLNTLYDGLMHDADIAQAREDATIDANNKKIETKRIKAVEQTDGIPVGGGSDPAVGEEAPEEEYDIFAEINDHKKRRNL